MRESLRKRLAAKARRSRGSRSGGIADEFLTDENTTNSETSEGNNLYNEINWEENIEAESSDLIDEFAPRMTSNVAEKEKKETIDESKEIKPESDIIEQEFRPGLKLFVSDFKSADWNEATIAEVDWDEDEVLVHYSDVTKSEEWVAMSSQRLSKSIPSAEDNPIPPAYSSQTSEIVIKPNSAGSSKRKNRNRNIKRGIKGIRPLHKKIVKKAPIKEPTVGEPVPASPIQSKFEIGEKVLAKWSEHRMQKFPAIIKNVVGNGNYDVLFYDGFEKTLYESNLYKTTEEECAKYRHSNPSEADSFVDMDDGSKEARRQRKKKTFDDFFWTDDINKKKTPVAPKKPHFRVKDVRRDKKKKKIPLPDANLPLQTSPMQEIAGVAPVMKLEVQAEIHEPPLEVQQELEAERWTIELPEEVLPLSIMTAIDGMTLRTVVIPDKKLPPGWTKHAVQLNQAWKTFLISPDKCKLNNAEELRDYFNRVYKTEPKDLDFTFNENLIPELTEKQKDLEAIQEPFRNWVVKKKPGRKPGLGGKSPTKVGKVRTLLPKYRFEPYVTSPPESEKEWKCVKEGCTKKFRKESLLQMHIKHYHVEYESLVGSAPNMVDLALARSEFANANAEPGPSKSPFPIKRILPKTPGVYQDGEIKLEDDQSLVQPSTPMLPRQDKIDLSNKRLYPEEKKSTIKTLLPYRYSSSINSSRNFESDDFESDEEKYKPQPKYKKSKLHHSGPKERSHIYPVAPGLRYIKKKAPMLDKLHIATDSNDSYEEERGSPIGIGEDGLLIEKLKSEEIINCTCGYREEDGLMIQCDICLCWQHGMCNGIDSDSLAPEQYVCHICRAPRKARSSKMYSYAIHYLTQGKLPSFSFRMKNAQDIQQREFVLKRVYEISQRLNEIKNVDQSLRAKINIAEQPNHPKHYLWANSWSDSLNSDKKKLSGDRSDVENRLNQVPIPPEAQIDSAECRLRLLEHVDEYLQQMDDRLTSLQTQIAALESQDVDLSGNASPDKMTKQTLQMLLKDLKTVQNLASIS